MRVQPFALCTLLAAIAPVPLHAQSSPPHHHFGLDTTRTGVFTGAGTAPGLSCTASAPPMECSGFLASDLDGTELDATVRIPSGEPPSLLGYPMVVNLHGYGGSKHSDSAWDDKLVARGYAVLRYSARGFGKSWGQVNLADLNVELRDLRSLIGQVVDASDDLGLRINGDAVAILGASYGGGQSWLAALQPEFETRRSKIHIRTIVPIVPWTDLLGALRPNGRETNSIDVPGFYKLSYIQGLFLGGLRRDPERPYPNYPGYLLGWNAYILLAEPNKRSPLEKQIVDGVAGYRSIWWQEEFFRRVEENAANQVAQLPVFELQGFTDDLFPLPEALRMYRALKGLDANYPIAEYFGDIGHPRAANKGGEVDYALERVFEWLDFYLKGSGAPSASCHDPAPQLRCDVLAAVTRPASVPFDGLDVLRVDAVDDLRTASGKETFSNDAVLTFNPANLGGLFFDPFVFSGCDPLQPVCTAPPPDLVPGDLAVYTVPASSIASSAGLPDGPFLVAGQPRVSIEATTPAYRVQLDVRLYDVSPSGESTLITRGTYALDSGSPLVPLGTQPVEIVTYGNLMQVGEADTLRLEITNVDTPYIAPSKVPSVTHISKVALEVPVRPPLP
jgi:ABC-2 type transport system ATP-binding protein